MEWTREERYQRIEDVDETYLEQLKHQVDTSLYRQTFHIQPEMGLLNDPNGLIYYEGYYYISHQWFPLGAVHGLKYWFNYKAKIYYILNLKEHFLNLILSMIVMAYTVEVLLNIKIIFIICIQAIIVTNIGIEFPVK